MKSSITTRLFFAGDFCSKPSSTGISVSEELKRIIASCDIKSINFEAPLKPESCNTVPKGRERLYQNDDVPAFLLGLGFNLFSIANNHIFDWGEEGFNKTKSYLGDLAYGAGSYEDAYRVKIVTINGIKIGFISLCFAAYTGVFDTVFDHKKLGCAYINDLRVNHVILQAKKEVDYLFILAHDGIEYVEIPLPETIARYRDFIDYGADGVIGTHPHCPQGWENYRGKPIFYSLGNFLFNSKDGYSFHSDKPHWYEGLCAIISIEGAEMHWEVINVKNENNIAIVMDHDGDRDRYNGLICNYIIDDKQYFSCLSKICSEEGEKELSIIDKTVHNRTIITTLLSIIKCCWNRIRRVSSSNDYQLKRLLTHDARRQLLLWTVKIK